MKIQQKIHQKILSPILVKILSLNHSPIFSFPKKKNRNWWKFYRKFIRKLKWDHTSIKVGIAGSNLIGLSIRLPASWLVGVGWSDTAKNGLWLWPKILVGRICRRDLEGPNHPPWAPFYCPKLLNWFGKDEGLQKPWYILPPILGKNQSRCKFQGQEIFLGIWIVAESLFNF